MPDWNVLITNRGTILPEQLVLDGTMIKAPKGLDHIVLLFMIATFILWIYQSDVWSKV